MPTSRPPQNISISNVLETSRAYLGLPERRRLTRSPYRHLRRAILRLALLIGSLGSLFGGMTLAATNLQAARTPDEISSIVPAEPAARSRIETMP